jgi:hypothetical protein
VRVTRIGPNNDSNGKPFVYEELLARMRAVHRRANGPRHARLVVQDLDIDLASRVVRVGCAAVQLSAKEYDLLVALAEDPRHLSSHGTPKRADGTLADSAGIKRSCGVTGVRKGSLMDPSSHGRAQESSLRPAPWDS